MMTPEQSAVLKDYFPVKSHEFLQGATYLSEEAITDRLDEVDPSWEFHRLGEFAYRENYVIATFRMTVCGVSRDGIGMWDLKMKKKDGTMMDAVDPEKSVSTDALKRAGRLFGIGRYILEMKGVNDSRTLEQWLNQRRGVNADTGEIKFASQNGAQSNGKPEKSAADKVLGTGHNQPRNLVKQTETPLAPQNAANANVGANSGNPFKYYRTELFLEAAKVKTLADVNSTERNNTIIAMENEGAFTLVDSYQACIDLVIARIASPEHGKKKQAG